MAEAGIVGLNFQRPEVSLGIDIASLSRLAAKTIEASKLDPEQLPDAMHFSHEAIGQDYALERSVAEHHNLLGVWAEGVTDYGLDPGELSRNEVETVIYGVAKIALMRQHGFSVENVNKLFGVIDASPRQQIGGIALYAEASSWQPIPDRPSDWIVRAQQAIADGEDNIPGFSNSVAWG